MRALRFFFALAMTLVAVAISRSFSVAAVADRDAPASRHAGVDTQRGSDGLAAGPGACANWMLAAKENSVEAAMLADVCDGRLSDHSLLRAALIASGSYDPAVWTACERRLGSLIAEFRAGEAFAAPMAERVAAIHDLLFRRVLTGAYDSQVNDLSELFRAGNFNCVTASTLLMAFAAKCGVETLAVEAPAHVLVIVDPRGAAVLVEMTSRDWRLSLAMNSAGSRRSPGRVISAEQLLATYYHNRGVQRLAERDFARAVAANQTALAIDGGCQAARQNLLAGLSQWALALADAGDVRGALEKIDAALAIAPDSEPLRENRVYIEFKRGAASPVSRSAQLAPRIGPVAPKFF